MEARYQMFDKSKWYVCYRDDTTPAQFNEESPGFYDEYLRILKNYENG